MKASRLFLVVSLLLLVSFLAPSALLAQSNTCEKQCKVTFKQCVQDTGDRPVCEAGYAFCLECCTGGCLTGSDSLAVAGLQALDGESCSQNRSVVFESPSASSSR